MVLLAHPPVWILVPPVHPPLQTSMSLAQLLVQLWMLLVQLPVEYLVLRADLLMQSFSGDEIFVETLHV